MRCRAHTFRCCCHLFLLSVGDANSCISYRAAVRCERVNARLHEVTMSHMAALRRPLAVPRTLMDNKKEEVMRRARLRPSTHVKLVAARVDDDARLRRGR